MSAAERIKQSRRQRLETEIAAAAQAFAAQLVAAIVTYDLTSDEENPVPRRRASVRKPYVPDPTQPPSAEMRARVSQLARRRGLP